MLEEAKRLIEESKTIMKTLYQLCFIATSENPKNKEAMELIRKMKEKGLVSEEEVRKALIDVKRWRELVLDRVGRKSVEEI